MKLKSKEFVIWSGFYLIAAYTSYRCANYLNHFYIFQTSKEANISIQSRLKCAAGLADLATRKYKSAAKYFLQVNFDYCEFPEVSHNFVTYCYQIFLSSNSNTNKQTHSKRHNLKTSLLWVYCFSWIDANRYELLFL